MDQNVWESFWLKRNTVRLCPYVDDRTQNAISLKKRLKDVLGDTAIDIQHVGSTAIVGFQAKPIIDMIVWVYNLEDIYLFIPKLEKIGVIHRGDNDNQNQVFFACGDLSVDVITHHIHVIIYKTKVWNDYIMFRDILNNDAEKRNKYLELKQSLSSKFANDRKLYTLAKNDFIQSVLKAW